MRRWLHGASASWRSSRPRSGWRLRARRRQPPTRSWRRCARAPPLFCLSSFLACFLAVGVCFAACPCVSVRATRRPPPNLPAHPPCLPTHPAEPPTQPTPPPTPAPPSHTPTQLRAAFQRLESEFKAVTDAEKAEVQQLGGLHVIGTERHESRRIDNQARCAAGGGGGGGGVALGCAGPVALCCGCVEGLLLLGGRRALAGRCCACASHASANTKTCAPTSLHRSCAGALGGRATWAPPATSSAWR